MKKYVIILSVVLVISILLVGCNTKNKLSVFYVNETDLWETKSREYYTDKNILETTTIEFENQTYSGEYNDSEVRFKTNYLTDVYKFDSGRFHINAETRELTVISFYLPIVKEKKISIEEGEKIAVNIAEKYIDISNYTLEKYETEYDYQYTFEKELGGVRTAENFSISVTFDGKIKSLAKIMLGAFPNPKETEKYEKRVKEVTGVEATELVNKAIKEKYPAVTEYSAPWNITDKWLVLDENNNICALYKVELEATYDQNIIDEYGGIKQTSSAALDYILIK